MATSGPNAADVKTRGAPGETDTTVAAPQANGRRNRSDSPTSRSRSVAMRSDETEARPVAEDRDPVALLEQWLRAAAGAYGDLRRRAEQLVVFGDPAELREPMAEIAATWTKLEQDSPDLPQGIYSYATKWVATREGFNRPTPR